MKDEQLPTPGSDMRDLLSQINDCRRKLCDSLAGVVSQSDTTSVGEDPSAMAVTCAATSAAMGEALEEFFPELSPKEREDLSWHLLKGVMSGRVSDAPDTVPPERPEELAHPLESAVRELTPEERRQLYLNTICVLFFLAQIDVTPELYNALSAENEETLKKTIVDFNKEQDPVRSEELLGATQMPLIKEISLSDERFSSIDNDWITAAAICAVTKKKKEEECVELGRRTARWRRLWERIREPLLLDVLPIAVGIGTMVAWCVLICPLPAAALEFLSAHMVLDELICSGFAPVITALWACAGAASVGMSIVGKAERRQEAEEQRHIRSKVLEEKAKALTEKAEARSAEPYVRTSRQLEEDDEEQEDYRIEEPPVYVCT